MSIFQTFNWNRSRTFSLAFELLFATEVTLRLRSVVYDLSGHT